MPLSQSGSEAELQLGTACRDFRAQLRAATPNLSAQIDGLVHGWVEIAHERLKAGQVPADGKVFNDPVWGSISLSPYECLILDTLLLQRLRGIRQLGMAYYVFPGAGYDRLEHIRGVVEGASRIINALDRSAQNRKPGADALPRPTEADREAIRLAALLHDIGHGPFSHATEELIRDHYREEFDRAEDVILTHYDDSAKVAPGEILTILMILSTPFLRIITHALFDVVAKDKFPLVLVSVIIGSQRYLSVPYLAGVVSGPIDADKLDYMSRDSHHAGLTLGLETVRLLSQLQVVTVTADNAPTPDIRKKAESKPDKKYYDLGISRAGIGAYEQMIVGRAVLYDRIYYHHKIRAAEAMIRRLVYMVERDRGAPLDLANLLPALSDEAYLCVLGGVLTAPEFPTPSPPSRALAEAIRSRDLFCRGYAFAARYLAGFDGFINEQDRNGLVSILGREIMKIADDPARARILEDKIAKLSRRVAELFGDDYRAASSITTDDIIIDVPRPDKVTVSGQDILVRSGSGDIELPNIFFDSEKWSQAYQAKKHTCYVFCRREYGRAVNLASKIVFAEELGLVMNDAADRTTKMKPHSTATLEQLRSDGLVTADAFERLIKRESAYARIHADDIIVPPAWTADGRDVRGELAKQLTTAKPQGFTAGQRATAVKIIERICLFYEAMYEGGSLRNVKIGEEKKLQEKLRDHLRATGDHVDEGLEIGGGESDLIYERLFVIENKIYPSKTDNPLSVALNVGWQARRYTIPASQEIVVSIIGYEPNSEKGIKSGRDLIEIRRLLKDKTPNLQHNAIEIRLAVPVNYPVPSSAKAPV